MGKSDIARSMPVDIDDFLSSPYVRAMDEQQRWWYLELLMNAWRSTERPCHLPDDIERLWVLAGARNRESFSKRGGIVLERFSRTGDGYLVNNKQLEVFNRQMESYTKRRAAGRLGGLSKQCLSNATAMPEQREAQTFTSSSGFDVGSKESKSNTNQEVVTTDDAVQYVTIELGLGGSELRLVLQEQIFRQLEKVGIQPKDTAEAMVLSWRIYEQTDVEFRKGPVKFFSDGSWRKSPDEWKRKSGKTNELLNNLARAKANIR